MPYRKLPNTNRARLKALRAAVRVGRKYDESYQLAFPYTLLDQAGMLLPQYERKVAEYEQSRSLQSQNSRDCVNESRMARMYVSHFVQVLNMCVQRGEIKPEMKELYGLKPDDFAVPDISTDEHLAQWGRRIIDGENERKRLGGLPIYNPPITKVSVYYDTFIDKYSGVRVLQENTARSSKGIAEMNSEVDSLLLQIWNEVEKHFGELPPGPRLTSCREYGLIYYYRKGEAHVEGDNLPQEDAGAEGRVVL